MENTLKDIRGAQLKARQDHNRFLTGILTALIGEINIVGINDGHRETTEVEVQEVVKKFLKNVTETTKVFIENSDGSDISVRKIKALEAEIEIYKKYLPVQLDRPELMGIVEEFVSTSEQKQNLNIGMIMKHLKENYTGLYDGKLASEIARMYV